MNTNTYGISSKWVGIGVMVLVVAVVVGWSVYGRAVYPDVVENEVVTLKDGDSYKLTAGYVTKEIAGVKQTMLAYNGSIPGPTIQVEQGAHVTIHFTNQTDMPALLHSHGVRMDAAYDGSQLVQTEMRPGESFDYKLSFPDPGVYWYHPHVQEVYGQALGLYGAFMVKPRDGAYFPPVTKEVPLFISDLPVIDGEIKISKNDQTHTSMGHFGNVMLVNGQEQYVLKAQAGDVMRFYAINAANARPFNLHIKDGSGNDVVLKRVGGDNGGYERASRISSIILGPSERSIFDVMFPKAGTYSIVHITPDRVYNLGTVQVGASQDSHVTAEQQAFDLFQVNRAVQKSIDPYRGVMSGAPQKHLVLTVQMDHGGSMMSGGMNMSGGMMHMQTSADGIEWEDTGMMGMDESAMMKWTILDQDTGKRNMDIHWRLKKDIPVLIRITNDGKSMHPMQHPIHFHGQRFLVVARDGVRQEHLVWKDTALVTAGETVDILLVPATVGEWMTHCHISEHLQSGMMFGFSVVE